MPANQDSLGEPVSIGIAYGLDLHVYHNITHKMWSSWATTLRGNLENCLQDSLRGDLMASLYDR